MTFNTWKDRIRIGTVLVVVNHRRPVMNRDAVVLGGTTKGLWLTSGHAPELNGGRGSWLGYPAARDVVIVDDDTVGFLNSRPGEAKPWLELRIARDRSNR